MSEETDGADVLKLKVPFKKPIDPGARVLEVVYQRCFHRSFLIDDTLNEVTCKACGEKLNPMYALKQLAYRETQFHRHAETYQQELVRLRERSRTKCEHCKKMTRISGR